MRHNQDQLNRFIRCALAYDFISQNAAEEFTGAGIYVAQEFLDLYDCLPAQERHALFPLIDQRHYARTYGVSNPMDQVIDFVRSGPLARPHPHPLIHFDYIVKLRPDFAPDLKSAVAALELIAEYEVALSPWLSSNLDEALGQLRQGVLDPAVALWIDPAYLAGRQNLTQLERWQEILDFASTGSAAYKKPSARFDPQGWIAANAFYGPETKSPFLHFLIQSRIHGFPEKIDALGDFEIINPTVFRKGILPDRSAPPLKVAEMDVSENLPLGRDQQPLAVCLHIFYLDVAQNIVARLEQSGIPLKIYATVPPQLNDQVVDLLEGATLAHHVQVVENRGRDIAPFLASMAHIVDQGHEFLLKLHTKKSFHRNDGEHWANDLFDALTDRDVMRFVIDLMRQHETIGFAAPDGHVLPITDYILKNNDHVLDLIGRLGLNRGECRQNGHFMAGSMFFARVAALKPLLDLGLRQSDFDEEAGQVDGTLAHGIERVMALAGWQAQQKLVIFDQRASDRDRFRSFY